MITESIQDIVTHASQGDPQALQSSLDTALREKITAALETKKHEISKNLVGLGETQVDEMYKKGEGDDDKKHQPARVPQRTMNDTMAARVKGIASKKGLDKGSVQHILYNQGYGRKSLNKVTTPTSGGALTKTEGVTNESTELTEGNADHEEHRVRKAPHAFGENEHGYVFQNREVNHPTRGTSAWENVSKHKTEAEAHQHIQNYVKQYGGKHVSGGEQLRYSSN